MAATPDIPQLALACFETVDASPEIKVRVHFNPASLQYTIQNASKEEAGGGKKKQHVTQSTAKLTMDLVFDTTDTGADVRKVTDQMAQLMKAGEKTKAPPTVKFGWGLYKFQGLIDQYKETLDYFSASGAPLRSTINITMTAQDAVFESGHNADTDVGRNKPEPVHVPATGPGAPPSASSVANDLGAPFAARAIASLNGEASLRFGASAGFSADAGISVSAEASFGAGAGGGISVDASVTLAPAAAFSAGGGAGLSIGAGAGIGGGAGIGIGGGIAIGGAAGGAFGGLHTTTTIVSVSIPDPRVLIEARPAAALGPGVQFGPGGRALSAAAGASLSADVGANADLSARLTFS
jgi:hypothetical protein